MQQTRRASLSRLSKRLAAIVLPGFLLVGCLGDQSPLLPASATSEGEIAPRISTIQRASDQEHQRLLAAFDDPEEAATHSDPYQYYPRQWLSPYIDRRRKVGMQLYGLLGIQKGDAKRMHEQFARNYKFFDAPVGLIFTVDRVMEQGSWLDYGMFLENVMLAAKARGLDTCPQAALIQFHRLIRQEVGIPDNETLICGMSLGHADPDAPENALRTERAALAEWVAFRD